MTQSHLHTRAGNTVVAWMFVLYVLFVVYGSLVPLQYVGRSLGDAVQVHEFAAWITGRGPQ